MKKKIETYEDVEKLVRSFYGKVVEDELLSPHFTSIHWEEHFPRMIDFWAFILIDKEGYKGNVFDKHSRLALNKEHFERWVQIFCETVDESFEGEKALLAKQRAQLLKFTFMNKLGIN